MICRLCFLTTKIFLFNCNTYYLRVACQLSVSCNSTIFVSVHNFNFPIFIAVSTLNILRICSTYKTNVIIFMMAALVSAKCVRAKRVCGQPGPAVPLHVVLRCNEHQSGPGADLGLRIWGRLCCWQSQVLLLWRQEVQRETSLTRHYHSSSRNYIYIFFLVTISLSSSSFSIICGKEWIGIMISSLD